VQVALIGRIIIPFQPRQIVHETPSQPVVGCAGMLVIPVTVGSIKQDSVQACLHKKQDPIPNITKVKKG
jgi:hypothetical protein